MSILLGPRCSFNVYQPHSLVIIKAVQLSWSISNASITKDEFEKIIQNEGIVKFLHHHLYLVQSIGFEKNRKEKSMLMKDRNESILPIAKSRKTNLSIREHFEVHV